MRGPIALSVVTLLAAVLIAGCGEKAEPPAGPAFGFNEAWAMQLDKVGMSAEAGADTDRLPLAWSRAEPQPGRFNWRVPDLAYRTMLAAGIRPLFAITGTPCWAAAVPAHECLSGEPASYAPDPAHVDDFARFTAAAARRYPEAQGLEIWNEPNLPKFWQPRPDPELYGRLLRSSADAIHATGSPVPVVTAGLSPVAVSQDGKIAWPDFLRRMNGGGGIEAADAVAFHPYPPHHHPQDVSADVADVRDLMERLRELLARIGDAGEPIWVTEVGISTTGPAAVTPDEQAEALREIYDDLAADDDVRVVLVHSFFDHRLGPAEWNSGTGVVTTSGDRKPAYCALAEVRGRSC